MLQLQCPLYCYTFDVAAILTIVVAMLCTAHKLIDVLNKVVSVSGGK